MTKRGKSVRAWLARQGKEWKMAAMGVVLATRKWKFWAVFLTVFIIFGTLLSLLSGGMGAVNLFFAADLGGKMQILGGGLLALLGFGRSFLDWLLIFLMAVLQATLIALIALIWKKQRAGICPVVPGMRKKTVNEGKEAAAGSLQNAGIAAGLALIGSGCPTCGTAILTPILGAIFSTGSYAIAGIVSGLVTLLAVIIALFSLKRAGTFAYAIMVGENKRGKHGKNN